jgi:DNA adenine methylase
MKPILKWAGGKRQLLKSIKDNLPPKMDGSYYEPFFGGGALFFEIAPTRAYLNDLNEDLIGVYNVFFDRNDLNKLMNLLIYHQKNHSKEYFYSIRAQDRLKSYSKLNSIKKAARLVYLNKSCFNGLYRVNADGYFNVPFNQSKKVNLFDKNNYDNIHSFFSKNTINFSSKDYMEALKGIKKGDFVYFDPPYDDLDNKKSFTSYSKSGFTKINQIELAMLYKSLSDKGVNCLLSNHDTEFIISLYSEFKIIKVKALRMINSKIDGRKAINEVLIRNY